MPGGASDDAERATIRRITSEILAAVNTSDHERLLAVWADDGVLMPPNRPAVQGREALERHFREVFTERRFRVSFSPRGGPLARDVALVRPAPAPSRPPPRRGPAAHAAPPRLPQYRRPTAGGGEPP